MNELINQQVLSEKRVLPEMIEASIAKVEYVTLPDNRSTLCQITLTNGFTVNGISSVICKENYNEEAGKKAAYKKAIDEVYQVLGVILTDYLFLSNKAEVQLYKHHSGKFYELTATVLSESDNTEMAVYRCTLTGTTYVRPMAEFKEKFTRTMSVSEKEYKKLELKHTLSRLLYDYEEIEAQIAAGQTDDMTMHEWNLLKSQLTPMREYHEILCARVQALD